MRPQRTIAGIATVEGYGYWSGRDVRLEFRPAPPDTGLIFVRQDLPSPVRIPALISQRVEMPRRTALVCSEARVELVEHALAACAGLQVDNCEIWLDQCELPGLDGSSLGFVAAIDAAGIEEQLPNRPQLVVTETIRVGGDHSWIEARPSRHAGLTLSYELDYGEGPIGRQEIQVALTPASFRRELAAARTFLMQKEAEWLRSRGLGRRVTARDLLVFDDHGVRDNELRFPDECVRHKALDVVGDFALAGCDIVGHIVAHRSGHRLNAEMVCSLLTEGQIFAGHRRSA